MKKHSVAGGKKTKTPARHATQNNNQRELELSKNFLSQYDDDYWHGVAGGEKREQKKKEKMKVSGKSVFGIKEILKKKK